MPLQTSAEGVPGVQVSPGTPALQVVTPLEEQAPTPQLVGAPEVPSSTVPLQLSSMPLQVSAEGVPATQLSTVCPLTQEVDPVEWHAPIPHWVA